MAATLADFTDEVQDEEPDDVVWTIERPDSDDPVRVYDDEDAARDAYEKYQEQGATNYGLVRQSAENVEEARA